MGTWEAAGVAAVLAMFVQEPPEITASVPAEQWIAPDTAIELHLNRSLARPDERVVVMVGNTDVTGLFVHEPRRLVYQSDPVALPAGESPLAVYVVSASNQWRLVLQQTLRVLTGAGFQRAAAAPKVDVVNAGQVGAAFRPDSSGPARQTYQDVTFNLGMQTVHTRNARTVTTQVNLVGVSHRPEALRFGLKGLAAPKLDLADYLLAFEAGPGRIEVGHVVFAPHRHLISPLASRGVGGTLRLWQTQITAAVVNATSLVGFDNPLGLSERQHRLWLLSSATELAPRHPAAARLDISFVEGSRLPLTGFTQGHINDAEKGRGGAVRFVSNTMAGRLRFDAGSSRSRFTNPTDSLLAGGLVLLPVHDRTDDAHYVDASVDVIRGALRKSVPVNLTGTYRFERVDPLYRTIGGMQAVRPDVLMHTGEAGGNLGALSGQISVSSSHDNLDRVESILTTKTRTTSAMVALPTAALQRSASLSPWLPAVTWTMGVTTQIGNGVRPNGGFASVSQVPDQVSSNHVTRFEWSSYRWRAAYALSQSLVDNRQEGRAAADFAARGQQLMFALSPTTDVSVAVDVFFDRAESRELPRINRTIRLGVSSHWRIASRTTASALVNHTTSRERAVTRNDVIDVNVQFSQDLPLLFLGRLIDVRVREDRRAQALRRKGEAQVLLAGVDAVPLEEAAVQRDRVVTDREQVVRAGDLSGSPGERDVHAGNLVPSRAWTPVGSSRRCAW